MISVLFYDRSVSNRYEFYTAIKIMMIIEHLKKKLKNVGIILNTFTQTEKKKEAKLAQCSSRLKQKKICIYTYTTIKKKLCAKYGNQDIFFCIIMYMYFIYFGDGILRWYLPLLSSQKTQPYCQAVRNIREF
jgi:hypothetical protein